MDLKIDKDTIYFEGLLTLKQVKPKSIDKKINKIKNDIRHIDISKVDNLDTAGAYFIIKLANTLKLSKKQIIVSNNKNKNKNLIDIVFKNFPCQKDEELVKKN